MTADHLNWALLLLRLVAGLTIIAHGVNHGRNLAGTARWFEKVGFRSARMQAILSTAVEVVAGSLLVLGLLTPYSAAIIVATMVVAAGSIHRFNGFFIFRKGEGWEYVNMLGTVAMALAITGPGEFSIDAGAGVPYGLPGWLIGLGGIAAGIGQLILFWRKPAAAA